jgi:glucose-1-phosphate thymidylyltransferase
MTDRFAETDIVGLIPAAGKASRISPLPCSKEILPVGFRQTHDGRIRPKVASHYLLEKFRLAGATKVYFILRNGKWDIPAYYGDGTTTGMDFAYLLIGLSYGVPYTLDQAYPFVRDAKVMTGFPDIIFGPDDAFVLADRTLDEKKADIVIGLYPVKNEHQVRKCDMVRWNRATGRIDAIEVKPQNSDLQYSWVFAIWTSRFTRFMHEYLKIDRKNWDKKGRTDEIHLGHIVQQAIAEGLKVYGQPFIGEHFVDIGTPNELSEAYLKYRKFDI